MISFRPLHIAVFVIFIALALAGCRKSPSVPKTVPVSIAGDTVVYLSDIQTSFHTAVSCGGTWSVSVPYGINWLYVTPSKGDGQATITFDLAANTGARRQVIVRISSATSAATLRIIQQGPADDGSTVLFYENAGLSAVASMVPAVSFSQWGRSGAGAGDVSYSGANCLITSAINSSGRYSGASGGNNCMLPAGASLEVKDISLLGIRTATLGFGCCKTDDETSVVFNTSELAVEISVDRGDTWSAIGYTRASVTGWGLAAASVNFTSGTEKLSVRFRNKGTTEIRIDDIRLSTFDDIANPDPKPVAPIVSVVQATNVTTASAVLSASYVYPSQSPSVTAFGIEWRTASQEEYQSGNRFESAIPATPSFAATASGLNENTAYIFRGYVRTSEDKTYYSQELSFTTAQSQGPVMSLTLSEASSVTSSSVAFEASYSYKLSYPAVTRFGVMWKTASQTEYPDANRVISETPLTKLFPASITGLDPGTAYDCRAYVTTSDGENHYSAPRSFTTLAGYVPPVAVTSFTDDFETITASGVQYPSANWLFSNSIGESTYGWYTVLDASSSPARKYLECFPSAASQATVTAYAMLPPLNVKDAAAKRLAWKLCCDYVSYTDGTKLEIVGCMDFNGDFAAASWSAIKNISVSPASYQRGTWIEGEADLSGLSYSSCIFLAFRYTGKQPAYRLDDVNFGIPSTPDPQPTITWGQAQITINSGFRQNEPSSATIRIPYSGNNTLRTVAGVKVTPSGAAATGFSTLNSPAVELKVPSGELQFTVSGTPTKSGEVRFAITGLPGLASPANGVTATVAAAPAPASDFSAKWNFSLITQENWINHTPICGIVPNLVGSIVLTGNLRQNGVSWTQGLQPVAGMWGGCGFYGNRETNVETTAMNATFKIKSQSKSLSFSNLSVTVRRSNSGPAYTALLCKVSDGELFDAGRNTNGGVSGANTVTFPLSGIVRLQNVPAGTEITFILVPYGASADSGTWYLTGTDAIVIDGTEN